MRTLLLGTVFLTGCSFAFLCAAQVPPQTPTARPCCGGMPHHHLMQGMDGSMARHHAAMMTGVPPPYTNLSKPRSVTSETLARGALVYTNNCSACHGQTGLGDGPAGANLNPSPANLASLSNMPMSTSDAFLYWSIAEGGVPFGTAMPAFKATLSADDIWAVTAYVQAHLPPNRP